MNKERQPTICTFLQVDGLFYHAVILVTVKLVIALPLWYKIYYRRELDSFAIMNFTFLPSEPRAAYLLHSSVIFCNVTHAFIYYKVMYYIDTFLIKYLF